jgi:hypothetical protein
MANPNIVNVTSITGKTALAILSTVTANVITNTASSNSVYKLNTITLSNYTGVLVAANVSINRNSGTFYLAGALSVPPNSTLVLLAKDTSMYLEEGDVVQANVSANTSISFSSSYEIIS